MPRIPLRELEEARANPTAYRQKLVHAEPLQFRRGYFNALRDAIRRYHRNTAHLAQARIFLESQLSSFKSAAKRNETLAQFDWYVQECSELGWPTVRTRLNVSVSLPSRLGNTVTCTGQVGRVDLALTGGYAAWMLRNDTSDEWNQELQMPLIQESVAQVLGSPTQSVTIGVYAFKNLTVHSQRFSEVEIRRARRSLNRLLRRLGF